MTVLFCMRFLPALCGLVGHSPLERKKETICKAREQGSSQTARESLKTSTQTPFLPLVQDIRAQSRDEITTKAQEAMVLKAESTADSECQSSSKTIQTSFYCMQYGNGKAKSTALTVRRTTRRARKNCRSYDEPTANDYSEKTAEGQSAVRFATVTPEMQSRKSQRHLSVSNAENCSPHERGEVHYVSSVTQRGKKRSKV